MDDKTKLEAFIRGPCSPTIYMAGITGTALQVEIDCKTL